MRLPQAAPEEGGERDNHEHWSYWEIAGGEKHFAYIAGPTQWFIGHPSSRTKPCTMWMTQGAVACKRCADEKDKAMVGYVPLWRSIDWRPKFVIVYKSEREHVEKLNLHQRVVVGREKEVGAPMWVRTATGQEPPFNTTMERRRLPQDISGALLTIWGIPELVAWFRCRPVVSDNAVSLVEEKPAAVVKEKPAAAHKPDAQPYTAPDPTESEVLYDQTVNRIKDRTSRFGAKPSTNGTHDKKG